MKKYLIHRTFLTYRLIKKGSIPFYSQMEIIGSDYVMKGSECGVAYVNIPSCFSYNLAAFHDLVNKLLCELLPSDMYNNSDKFVACQSHHYFTITVSLKS